MKKTLLFSGQWFAIGVISDKILFHVFSDRFECSQWQIFTDRFVISVFTDRFVISEFNKKRLANSEFNNISVLKTDFFLYSVTYLSLLYPMTLVYLTTDLS